MQPRRIIAGIAALGLAASAAALALTAGGAPPPGRLRSEAEVRDLDIAFYQARIARDPLGARDRAELAGLYLQRARDTGNNQDLVRAEATARESLGHRRQRNGKALAVLVNSLLAQHRYPEGLTATRELTTLEAGARPVRAILGEIQMELGMYDSARATFASLDAWTRDLGVAPRLARWRELEGRPDEAHWLLVQARDNALALHALPGEQAAWFHLRVADLALRNGRLAEAERSLEAGLAAHPGDYRVLGLFARLAAVRHDWRGAVDWGEQAIARTLDPATLGVVGDAYRALGDTAKAEEYYRVLEVAVSRQLGQFHRAWSLFLLDHDRRVPEVLERARQELAIRGDIYGWDLYGWALHKAGRDVEARTAMAHALRLGTQDASLFFHAGMIERALGNRASARSYLDQALAVNPYWHPTQPGEARAALGVP